MAYGKYSPTISGRYLGLSAEEVHNMFDENGYDSEGFDRYGYNSEEVDREGMTEFDYLVQHNQEDELNDIEDAYRKNLYQDDLD